MAEQTCTAQVQGMPAAHIDEDMNGTSEVVQSTAAIADIACYVVL